MKRLSKRAASLVGETYGGGGNRLSSCTKGFTLAEVLVTLGIIGVVSAMTVPSLMQNYQRQSYLTQLHKVYNELMQATERYMTDNNAVNMKEAGLSSDAALDNFIKSNFKIVQDCGAKSTPCFAPNSQYRKINTSPGTVGTGQKSFVTLASGASFGYGYLNGAVYGEKVAIIDMDINGPKGPNIAGRDVFILGVFNNGMIEEYGAMSAPASAEERDKLYNDNCISTNTNWTGCFGKILNDNWQMTY